MQKLIVNGTTELDLDEAISMPIVFNSSDVKDITKRGGNYSKTIKLKGTDTNNKFFGGLYDVNADFSIFNPNIKTSCLLIVGSEEMIRGYLQLKNVYVDKMGLINYEVVLYDSAVEFWAKLDKLFITGNKNSSDDVDLSAMNHVWNLTNMQSSWTGDADTVGYFYPMLYNMGNATNQRKVTDFKPSIYHKRLL